MTEVVVCSPTVLHMPEEVPPDSLVIRFSPNTAEGALDRAIADFERSGNYRLSVFVGLKSGSDSDEVALQRALDASATAIVVRNNAKFWLCAAASELHDRGFTFHKDGEPDEPAEHYSVDLGDSPTIEDVRRFLEPFERRKRSS